MPKFKSHWKPIDEISKRRSVSQEKGSDEDTRSNHRSHKKKKFE